MEIQRCPSFAELEALANTLENSTAFRRHLEHCPSCRENVDALRENEATAGELRLASSSEINPPLRRRLMLLCRHAMNDVKG